MKFGMTWFNYKDEANAGYRLRLVVLLGGEFLKLEHFVPMEMVHASRDDAGFVWAVAMNMEEKAMRKVWAFVQAGGKL